MSTSWINLNFYRCNLFYEVCHVSVMLVLHEGLDGV